MSTLKLAPQDARLAVLYPNSMAKRSSVIAVVDKVFSSDYFTLMEKNNAYDRDGFISMIHNGIPLNILLTMNQVEELVRQNTVADDNNIERVFAHVEARHVGKTRINYCSKCGKYHDDGTSVFRVMPVQYAVNMQEGGHGEWWGNEDEYGVFCEHCHKSADLKTEPMIINHWVQRGTDIPEDIDSFLSDVVDYYGDWDDVSSTVSVEEFVSMVRENVIRTNATMAFTFKQLELVNLDFLLPMTKEQYNALPDKG